VGVFQRVEIAEPESQILELVEKPQEFEPVALQLAGQPRRRDALGEAADDQDELHRPPLRPLQRRAGVRVEDAVAPPATVIPRRVQHLAMNSYAIIPTALRAFQACQVQSMHEPLITRPRVHQFGDRKVHGRCLKPLLWDAFQLVQHRDRQGRDQDPVTDSHSEAYVVWNDALADELRSTGASHVFVMDKGLRKAWLILEEHKFLSPA
jgi:hypothetical protein